MFSSIGSVSAEPEALRLWKQESALAGRRRAVLDKAAAEQASAGERFLDEGAEAVSGAADALARLRAEADVIGSGIVTTRGRRQAAIEKQIAAQCDVAREELRRKEGELADFLAKREALIAKVSEIEQAPVAVVQADGYKPLKSQKIAGDVQGLQIQLSGLERATPKISGTIDASSAEDLLHSLEKAAGAQLVPSKFDTETWALAVEAKVRTERPKLLIGSLQVPSKIVSSLRASHSIGGSGSVPTGPAEFVQHRRQYSLAFQGGLIDFAKSTLIFWTDDGQVMFRISGFQAGGESATR